jgi:bacteriocin resistance YdeI/OmpD-like protein
MLHRCSPAGGVAASELVEPQRFTVTVADGGRGRLLIVVPFDPNQTWSVKPRHHITGTVNGMGVRGVLELRSEGYGFTLGPAWMRDCGVDVGDTVPVVLVPEGPQRHELAPDVADALAANPEAGAFFDSLAQFYRRAFLSWIDATKRSPARRAERIAQMIKLLDAGITQRPDS